MGRFYMVILFAFVLNTISCKYLHKKEEDSIKKIFAVESNILNNNNAYIEHERFARHVEFPTESSIKHFIKELTQQHPGMKKPRSLQTMMKDLKRRLKKYVQTRRPHRTKTPKPIKENIWKKVNPGKMKKKH